MTRIYPLSRISHRRTSLLLATVALAVVLQLLTSSNASARVLGFEVDNYRKDFGVSTANAEARLETQHRGSHFGIVEQLERRLGSTYAGVWFDNESGEFVVPTLPGTDRGALAAEFRNARLSDRYRTSPATVSWSELEAAHARVDSGLESLLAAQLVQTSLDPRTNAVVIHVAAGVDKAQNGQIRRLAKGENGRAEVRREALERFNSKVYACNVTNRVCDKPLRAGVWMSSLGEGIPCTAGFKATGNTYGNRFVLTAGHCYAAALHWRSTDAENYWHYVGAGEAGAYPVGDYAAIRVNGVTREGDEDWWEQETSWPSTVVYWGGSQNIPIGYESSSYLGQSVCYSGGSTGSSCGTVTLIDKTVNHGAGNIYHVTETNLPALGGDSGGPVWAGNTALGLIEGGIEGLNTYFTEITEATSAMQVTVGAKAGTLPYVENAEPTNIEARQATWSGKVDPNGLATSYHFEYGPTAAFGNSTQSWNAGSGWGTSSISHTVSLKPDTKYHYRLVATNSAGTVATGERIFTTPTGPPLAVTEGTSEVTANGATLHGKVEPGGLPTSYWVEWGPTTSYGAKSASAGAGSGIDFVSVTRKASALDCLVTYHYRLVAENSKGKATGADKTFQTPDWCPKADTWGIFGYNTRGGKAFLGGNANPNGYASTYHIEWAPTVEFEEEEFNVSEDLEVPGTAKENIFVQQVIEGLKGETEYSFRLVVENDYGEDFGDVESFTTPNWAPVLGSVRAYDVGREDATMAAMIDSQGFDTTYRFEWGKTDKYGNVVPVPDGEIEGGNGNVDVTETLEGLDQNQTYHFRVSAENAEGTKTSADHTFTTNTSGFVSDLDSTGHLYPVDHEFEQQGGEFAISMPGVSLDCYGMDFTVEGEEPEEELTTSFEEDPTCYLSGVSERTLHTNGCGFIFDPGYGSEGSFEGEVKIGPAECGPMTLQTTGSCVMSILPQSGLDASFENTGEEWPRKVEIHLEDSSLRHTLSAPCGTGEIGGAAIDLEWEVESLYYGIEYTNLRVVDEFRAAPGVDTGDASAVGWDRATLHGEVDPNMLETTYQFEYVALDEFYKNEWANASSLPVEAESVGEGEDAVAVEETVEDLHPHRSYAYQLVASNEAGSASGGAPVFTTARSQPRFEAGQYPATLLGEQDSEDQLALDLDGLEPIDCASGVFDAALSAPMTSMSLDAEYGECAYGESGEATISMNSCHYELGVANSGPPYSGVVQIACAKEGDAIEVVSPSCLTEIPPQSLNATVFYENQGEYNNREVAVSIDAEEVHYSYIENFCVLLGKEHEDGELSGGLSLEGENGEEAPRGVFLAGLERPRIGLFATGEESEEESQQPRFEAEGYSATLIGEEDLQDRFTLTMNGLSPLACNSFLDGEISSAGASLALEPEYSECIYGENLAHISMNSCSYVLDLANSGPPYVGAAEIACSEGEDAIEVTYPGTNCVAEIPPQSLNATVSYGNQGEGAERELAVSIDAEEVHYSYVKNFCVLLGEEHEDGTLSQGLTLRAYE